MAMQILTKCGRCGAQIEFKNAKNSFGGSVRQAPCALVSNVSVDAKVATSGAVLTVLCPDCIGQLNKWLTGEHTKDLPIAEGIIRDMYAALGAKPRRQQACEYLSGRDPVMCARCAEDPKQCVGEMFRDIRYRCAEIGIDLEEDEDAGERWQGQPEQAD